MIRRFLAPSHKKSLIGTIKLTENAIYDSIRKVSPSHKNTLEIKTFKQLANYIKTQTTLNVNKTMEPERGF
jgi:hypothetical protein